MVLPTNLPDLTSQSMVAGGTTAIPAVATTTILDGRPQPVSAALEVNSDKKGFLNARMDSQTKNRIVNPVAGLQVYDSTLDDIGFYGRDNEWKQIASGVGPAAAIQAAAFEYAGSAAIVALFANSFITPPLYIASRNLGTVIVGGYVVVRGTPFSGACNAVAVSVQNEGGPANAFVYASLPTATPAVWKKTGGITMTAMTLANSTTVGNFDRASPIVLAFLGGAPGAASLGAAGTDTRLEIYIYYANFFNPI